MQAQAQAQTQAQGCTALSSPTLDGPTDACLLPLLFVCCLLLLLLLLTPANFAETHKQKSCLKPKKLKENPDGSQVVVNYN